MWTRAGRSALDAATGTEAIFRTGARRQSCSQHERRFPSSAHPVSDSSGTGAAGHCWRQSPRTPPAAEHPPPSLPLLQAMAAAPPAAEAAAQKLQLLADALALEFSQSLASAQCSNALRRLLPGLEYLRCEEGGPGGRGKVCAYL